MMCGQYKKILFGLGLGMAMSVGTFSVHASPITSGLFTPDAVEDYEGTPGSRTVLTTLFGGDVSVVDGSVNHRSVDAGDWIDFRSSSAIVPNSGSRFGVGYGFGSYSLDFSGLGGIFGFSGWFSAAGAGSEFIEFFGLAAESLDIVSRANGFGPGDGTMEFVSVLSTVAIGSITISGSEIASDDLAYTTSRATGQIPVPGTLLLVGLGLAGLGLQRRRRALA